MFIDVFRQKNTIFFITVIPFRSCIYEYVCNTSNASNYNISPGGKGTHDSKQFLNPLLHLIINYINEIHKKEHSEYLTLHQHTMQHVTTEPST
jgi:hypothetical protein